ncbi:MBL fold metallo-hydrolase [Haloarcula salinisoli]|uniref:MBL fold metallo-hydrolase n=1 Tax=Haloarcula salinisoli TaxID=2487746 RepID=A0A8J7YGN0_9EURY|nr:MBL fold metallo-hydrolase [Halomicroarcula salinisoli]MBX0287270.1 MBL fold metallo-hydrolase [Halomicroarcula salinisoli]MBX0305167.1 MBL fold metallo-hydrolase [Halomicroarcula salinisoli]
MATRLRDGLWHIDCRTRDRPNVYLVAHQGECTLVDAGWPGDESTVRAGLADAGFGLDEVDRVLVTHYDADHVGTLGRLTPTLDCPVFVHRADQPYVAGDALPPWTARTGLEALHRLYYRQLTLPDLPIKPIQNTDHIGGFSAHHTPGHTPGHTVYVHEDVDAAFLGDLVYTAGDRLRPAGRLTSYDQSRVAESIERVLDRIDGFGYACPGHGPPLPNGDSRLEAVVDSA